jgi:hypothetical protein
MLIEIFVAVLLFIVVILIAGILSEYYKPFDIFMKKTVIALYKAGKLVSISMKEIFTENKKD